MNIYGAIIGDVVGSFYEVLEHNAPKQKRPVQERQKILDPKTPLFTKKCCFTDDSILTTAIAHAIISKESYEKYIRYYGLKETKNGTQIKCFGRSFVGWLNGYGGKSFGNGGSMRVSAIGYAFDSLEKTIIQAERATICSHSHHEAIDCAKAVAGSIYLARTGKSKQEIKKFAEKYLGSLDYDLEYLQNNYTFSSRAILSVPQAIYCFLVSENFEDCLRKSISIGGDSDTIACIACSIAGAYYEIPPKMIKNVKRFIPKEYATILDEFNNQYALSQENIM